MAATDDQIKKAHRFKVLKHHPDKRKAAGEEVQEGDDYFSCITKALDVLGNPQTRRAYDSVDPTFDDDVPDALKKDKQDNFFQVFGPKFEQNSRWSTINPVPQLGILLKFGTKNLEEVILFVLFESVWNVIIKGGVDRVISPPGLGVAKYIQGLCYAGKVVIALLDFLTSCLPLVRVMFEHFEPVSLLDLIICGRHPQL